MYDLGTFFKFVLTNHLHLLFCRICKIRMKDGKLQNPNVYHLFNYRSKSVWAHLLIYGTQYFLTKYRISLHVCHKFLDILSFLNQYSMISLCSLLQTKKKYSDIYNNWYQKTYVSSFENIDIVNIKDFVLKYYNCNRIILAILEAGALLQLH